MSRKIRFDQYVYKVRIRENSKRPKTMAEAILMTKTQFLLPINLLEDCFTIYRVFL